MERRTARTGLSLAFRVVGQPTSDLVPRRQLASSKQHSVAFMDNAVSYVMCRTAVCYAYRCVSYCCLVDVPTDEPTAISPSLMR